MRVAFGLKAHSGWAALVVLGGGGGDWTVVDRRRIELVEHEWAKAPYHAAEAMEAGAGRALVERALAAAPRIAVERMRAAVEREHERRNEVAACAVLVADPMPNWSTEEILAVHFRMHKAEGMLFRDALTHAARACGLTLVAIHEKRLAQEAERVLGATAAAIAKCLAALGRTAGPPWGKDQKDAALAALVALSGAPRDGRGVQSRP